MLRALPRRLAGAVASISLALGFTLAQAPGPAGTAAVSTLWGQTGTAPTTWAHVVCIWMENHSFDQIIGSSSAPFENQLANACGLATNYHNVTHPSLPNSIASTSGSTQGITSDCSPSSCPVNATSLFAQVAGAGRTRRAYQESMPSNCSTANTSLYAVKHNPQPYYTPLTGADTCASFDIPMGTTTSGSFDDLNRATLPSFSFVTLNLCNDIHDCSVASGDSWLSGWFNVIAGSAAYLAGNTAVVLTWDEGSGGRSGFDCSHNTSDGAVYSPRTSRGVVRWNASTRRVSGPAPK